MIKEIDLFVMLYPCKQARYRPDIDHKAQISVNVSSINTNDPKLPEVVDNTIA